MDINTEIIGDRLIEYDALIIDSLVKDFSTNIHLKWHVNDQPHELLLNHGSRSINAIDFKTTNPNQIQDLHLLISSDTELGVNSSSIKNLTFKSIYLDKLSNQTLLALKSSQWFKFNPVEIKSINGYSSYEAMYLENLLYRLMLWLLISTTLYFLLNIHGKHFVISLLLAWLIASTPFIFNLYQQHQQIKQSFEQSKSYINNIDQNKFRLSKSILSEIENNPVLSNTQQKYIIMGANDFDSLRLFYYLSELNIAIAHINSIDSSQNNIVYIMMGKYLSNCDHQNDHLTIISQNQDFCMAVSK